MKIVQINIFLIYYILNLVRFKCANQLLDNYSNIYKKGNFYVENNIESEKINDIILTQDLKFLNTGVTNLEKLPNIQDNSKIDYIFSEQQPQIMTKITDIDLNLISLGLKKAKILSQKLNKYENLNNSCKCSEKVIIL